MKEDEDDKIKEIKAINKVKEDEDNKIEEDEEDKIEVPNNKIHSCITYL